MGVYGVTNLTFLFNIQGATRSLRYSSGLGIVDGSVVLSANGGIEQGSTILYINYLTPHPSQLLSSRCVIPYAEFPRYQSPVTFSTPVTASYLNTTPVAGGGDGAPYANVYLKPSNAVPVQSQSLQLNMIPDKLIIYVKPNPDTAGTLGQADRFMAIESCAINWNNGSGLLSTFSQYDLWRASVDAGSNQSWNEFRGVGTVLNQAVDGANVVLSQKEVPLIGSLLVLDMGRTVQLVNDFDAPGSIGAYNLQFNLGVRNCDPTTAVTTATIYLITMNTGFMALEQGSSSVFTAILDKATVLSTSEQETYSYSQYKRQVGGGFLDVLKHVGKALLPVARKMVAESEHPYAKKADSALKMLGLGHSGGGVGFGHSGGALRRKLH